MPGPSLIAAVLAAAFVAFAGSALAAGKAPTPPITDPAAFVTGVYKRLATDRNYAPASDFYTPRLKALWADMEHDAGGEVGRVDFEFWTNAQDWEIKDVKVSSARVEQNLRRKVVIARFVNEGRPTEICFYFERVGGRWLLDDARSVGKDGGWTLSLILKYGWDGQ
jgi:hypothetical protein